MQSRHPPVNHPEDEFRLSYQPVEIPKDRSLLSGFLLAHPRE